MNLIYLSNVLLECILTKDDAILSKTFNGGNEYAEHIYPALNIDSIKHSLNTVVQYTWKIF